MSRIEQMVTVCDKCLRACCWQGILMCDDGLTASTIDLPISELKRLSREHPDYWISESEPV